MSSISEKGKEMGTSPRFTMIAKTLYGLEDVLTQELTSLGVSRVQPGVRMVSFEGSLRDLYRVNLHLRTALRVLLPIQQFEAKTVDEIYHYLKKNVIWEEYLSLKSTFAVDTVVYSSSFTHSKFVAYRVKDAIADYFVEKGQRRPNVSVTDPDLRFHLHISDTTVTLALDSSGESLHKRGYRVAQNDAPISEVLAAAIILKSGWKGETPFLDPMCGSGTFLTEAALIAAEIPPGIFRDHFAFERWSNFDASLFEELLEEWEEKPIQHKIYGSDIAPKAVAIARANIQKAGLQKYIELSVEDFRGYKSDDVRLREPGVLITNPPYGERLRPNALVELYEALGRGFKHTFSGWKAWVITSAIVEGFKGIGLKHFHREKLYNGTLECELRGYELFTGKRNDFLKELSDRGELRKRKEERVRREASRRAFQETRKANRSFKERKRVK